MTFEKTAEWRVIYVKPLDLSDCKSQPIIPPRFDTAIGRSFAATASILINALIVWTLLHFTGGTTAIPAAETVLTLISMDSAKISEAQEQHSLPNEASASAQVDPTIVNTTKNAQASEWRLSTISVAKPLPITMPSSGQEGTEIGSGGGNGGSGYDPYAGVAPLGGAGRFISGLAANDADPPISSSGGDPSIDQGELDRALEQFRRDEPRARGLCDVVVSVSPTGMALDVKMAKCALPAKTASKLKSALLGRPLVRGNAAAGRRDVRISPAALGLP